MSLLLSPLREVSLDCHNRAVQALRDGTLTVVESPGEQTRNLPSATLYMDWETAAHRVKALLSAIFHLSSFTGVNENGTINELASLGEVIIEDQLKSRK